MSTHFDCDMGDWPNACDLGIRVRIIRGVFETHSGVPATVCSPHSNAAYEYEYILKREGA
jgi:hypothetical protein